MVRVLGCEVSVVADDPAVLEALDRLLPRTAQSRPITIRHRIVARTTSAAIGIEENGREIGARSDARGAAELAYERIHGLAIAALAEHTTIHAACASFAGRRLLVVGASRSGKTTLMVRLLFEGFDVHGDDVVLLVRGDVIPYPRLLRVRREALPLLPELAPRLDRLPELGEHVLLDPRELGLPWRLDPAPASVVLFLEPGHGGPTRLEPVSRRALAERVMAQSTPPTAGGGAWARDVARLLASASGFVLRNGRLDETVVVVRDVCAGTTENPKEKR